MNKNILVCGGAGYIGSVCVRELSKNGFNCVIYDNFSQGHMEVCEGFETVCGELSDKELLVKTIREHKISGVIHFAALSLVGKSVTEPLEYYRNNVYGTISLLYAMVECGVGHIVFSSTCAIYGENALVPISETAEKAPCSPYGETKLAVENMLKWCDEAYGIKSACLRYFNAAGALPDGCAGEDHDPETHLIPLILKKALYPDSPLLVFGDDYPTRDGSCIRDYIHVLDLASAHVKALEHLRGGGKSEAFNLGTGEGFSVLEAISMAKEVTGADIPYKISDRRAGDPAILVADPKKAIDILGWRVENSDLRKIITDAWAFHKSHPNGYSPLP